MSVLIETSAGVLTVDLFCDECPITCQNFLKLASAGYYNGCLLFHVVPHQLVQTGDPTGTGQGGSSIHGLIQGDNHRFIRDEASASKHDRAGLLGMAKHAGPHTAGSQFYVTLGGPLQHMDRERHVVFGEVAEGLDVLASLDELFLDNKGRPLQDVRITATHVLFDPTPAVPGTATLTDQGKCSASGRPLAEAVEERLEYAASKAALAASVLAAEGGGDQAAIDAAHAAAAEEVAAAEARSRATVLEMVGDLPDADVAPPDTVLFVAKLNPVTTDEDLELIFSRHGEITACDIIRDWKTGESLCFAFIEFADRPACEQAFLKMNNVLIDDRRIKVDFSQSVSHLWNKHAASKRGDKAAALAAAARSSAAAEYRGDAAPLPRAAAASVRDSGKDRLRYAPGGGVQRDRDGGRSSYDRRDRDGGRSSYDRRDRDGGRSSYDRRDRDGGRSSYERL